MDVHTKEARSRNMRAIRSKDTRPEIALRKLIHAEGYRFRLHVGDLPGKPDLVFPKYRSVIFVNGCFWHSHDCRWGSVRPATNPNFWSAKREATIERDLRTRHSLEELGWRVMTVWECEMRNADAAVGGVLEFLRSQTDPPYVIDQTERPK